MGGLTPGGSTFSGPIDSLFMIVLVITGVAFVLVEFMLVYNLVRFRKREGQKAAFIHGNRRLELFWTVVPGVLLIGLAFYQYNTWVDAKIRIPDGDNVLYVAVTAKQFEWNVTYAGQDRMLDTADDVKAPVNLMHFPIDRPVVVRLTSIDVIHSFFIPALRVKQDALPGRDIRLWFQATEAGKYEVACAELCGLGHYKMRAQVFVEPQADFDAWLADIITRSE